jgi:hypothetical protein
MDPHFAEYLAAVAGMHDTYGEPPCEGTSEFHEEQREKGTRTYPVGHEVCAESGVGL